MSVKVSDKSFCSGCTACSSICPKGCINMQPDVLGFLYPVVDTENCIECGLCENVCQFRSDYNRYDNYSRPRIYALRHSNDAELLRSQSGGAFLALSECFLEEGGVVYGAAFDSSFRVVHKRAETREVRDQMRYSKYVQSDMSGVYHKVREDLGKQRKVMFTGTPCQVAGLRAYIGNGVLSNNLLTVDLICHGVPSPEIWKDYLSYLERKNNSELSLALFRDKRKGWKSCHEYFRFADGTEEYRTTSNLLFFSHLSVRESCSQCPYTNYMRVGDITIGDFWNGYQNYERFTDNKGANVLFLNSTKGEEIFNKVKEVLYHIEITEKDAWQEQLSAPIELNTRREDFIRDYERHGFRYVGKKYADLGIRHVIRRFLGGIKRRLS